jgi:hypothetical protein
MYLVRDVYFEPALGHRAEQVVARVAHKARLGQPALVEMHRFNYVDDVGKARASLAEFRRLLELTLDVLPGLRFVAPGELAEAIKRGDPDIVDTRLLGQLSVWLRRLWEVRRLRWLAFGTAAIVPAAVFWFVASYLTRRMSVGTTA